MSNQRTVVCKLNFPEKDGCQMKIVQSSLLTLWEGKLGMKGIKVSYQTFPNWDFRSRAGRKEFLDRSEDTQNPSNSKVRSASCVRHLLFFNTFHDCNWRLIFVTNIRFGQASSVLQYIGLDPFLAERSSCILSMHCTEQRDLYNLQRKENWSWECNLPYELYVIGPSNIPLRYLPLTWLSLNLVEVERENWIAPIEKCSCSKLEK